MFFDKKEYSIIKSQATFTNTVKIGQTPKNMAVEPSLFERQLSDLKMI